MASEAYIVVESIFLRSDNQTHNFKKEINNLAAFTNQAFLTYNGITTPSNTVVGELEQELTLTKTAVRDDYDRQNTVTYVLSMINSGANDQTDLTVTDDLGAYTFGTGTLYPLRYINGSVKYYLSGVLQPSPTVATTSPLTVTGINIPAGANVMLIYDTAVTEYASPEQDANITNTATVGDALAGGTSASATVTASNAPILTITKSINPPTLTTGSTVTYTFEIQNTGNAAATADVNAVIADMFDPKLADISVTYNGTAWTAGTEYTYDQTTGVFATVAGNVTVPAAVFSQNTQTGAWSSTPAASTLVITGTI